MGSGLILLVIVGAWLAVLVPMALRSHDSATSLRSADRFGDAMRVLSRRGARDVVVPRRPYDSLVVSETRSRAPRIPEERPAVEQEPVEERRPATAAERRRRTLLVLVGLALVTLGLALLTGGAWVVGQLVCDLLLAAFVVHLRRQAVLRQARARRAGPAVRSAGRAVTDRPTDRPADRPAAARRVAPAARRIAGIPDRMPPRPAPLSAPLPAPAARYEDKPVPAAAAATGTDGGWSPVPVPPPTYVGKPVAPPRAPRVLDLTKPGQWTATLEGEDVGLDLLDDGPELDEILDRRRAVNDW